MSFKDRLSDAIAYTKLERLKIDLLKHGMYEWASTVKTKQQVLIDKDKKVIANSKIIDNINLVP